jgi:hypothetical protein
MATVTTNVDTMLNVLFSTSDRTVGHNSIWASEVHPGTNNMIQGWEWDRRTWPSTREFEAVENIPSLWDPTVSGLDDAYWRSGYGDNYDLLLLGVEALAYSGLDIWAPKIHRGYFYSHDEEWYLYSDDYQRELFSASSMSISSIRSRAVHL